MAFKNKQAGKGLVAFKNIVVNRQAKVLWLLKI